MFACCTACYLLTRLFCPAGLYQGLCRLFTGCSCLIALLGILNAWGLDPLGTYYSLLPDNGSLYLSTIGNLNFFAAYLCLCLPLAVQTAFHARSGRSRAGVVLCCVVLLTGLLMASTDAAWLSLAVMLAVVFCDRRLTWHGARLLFAIGAIFCAVAFLTGIFLNFFPLRMPLRTVSAVLVKPFVCLPIGALLLFLFFISPRLKKRPASRLACCSAACFFCFCAAFWCVTCSAFLWALWIPSGCAPAGAPIAGMYGTCWSGAMQSFRCCKSWWALAQMA